MSDIKWCVDCGDIKWNNQRHQCPPGWLIWRPEYGQTEEDARTFYGYGPDGPVEQWAAWADSHSADYSIVNGSEATVHVRLRPEDMHRADGLRLPKDVMVFEVTGESTPSYHAHQTRIMTPAENTNESNAESEKGT